MKLTAPLELFSGGVQPLLYTRYLFFYIVDYLLDMGKLFYGKAADFYKAAVVNFKQIITAYRKKAGYLDEHIN